MTMQRIRSGGPSYGQGYIGGGSNMSYMQPSGGIAGGVSVSGRASGGPQMGMTLAVATVVLVGAYMWTRRQQGAR